MKGTRLAAAAIGALAIGLAIGWMLVMPIFQHQDESNHYDFALTLADAGRPLAAREGNEWNETHPVVQYLLEATSGKEVRADPYAWMPTGYGTPEFFRKLDTNAPNVDKRQMHQSPINPLPFYVAAYPIGYYGVAAGVIDATRLFSPHSVVAEIFAVRFLDVVLVALALMLSWMTLETMHLPGRKALLVFFLISVLPLTSQFASSVQPDDLVFFLAAIIFLVVSLARRDKQHRTWGVVGLALGCVMLVKHHYWASLAIATYAFAAVELFHSRWTRTKRIQSAAWLLLPSLIAYSIGERLLNKGGSSVTAMCPPVFDTKRVHLDTPIALAQYVFDNVLRTVDHELAGQSFGSFWLTFGSYGSPIQILFGGTDIAIAGLLVIGAIQFMIIALFIARRLDVFRRLSRVYHRSRGEALYLLTSNVALNTLLAFDAIILAYRVASNSAHPLQGRYWLPFLLPLALIAFDDAPRVVRNLRIRRAFTNSVAVIFVAFVCASAIAALPSVHQRYYAHKAVDDPSQLVLVGLSSKRATAPQEGSVRISGWAADMQKLAPAAGVFGIVDGDRRIEANFGLESPDAVCTQLDRGLSKAGFDLVVDTAHLAPGKHFVEIWVHRAREPAQVDSKRRFEIDVLG